MTPAPVVIALAAAHPAEVAVRAMVLIKIRTVGAILITIPRMVIMASSVVIAPFVMIAVASFCGNGHHHSAAEHKSTE